MEPTSTLIDVGDPTRFDLDGTRSDIGAFGGTTLLDSDLDGLGALIDCDDNDASAYPGAAFLESTSACMLDGMEMDMGIVHHQVHWFNLGKTVMMLILQ